ncbi:MAG TPA: hypothetical protein VNF46_03200 [Gammaproteobacteria bacterium]|nr:hypothetical protein [Gammaproteobacteria bacterium]
MFDFDHTPRNVNLLRRVGEKIYTDNARKKIKPRGKNLKRAVSHDLANRTAQFAGEGLVVMGKLQEIQAHRAHYGQEHHPSEPARPTHR